MFLPDMFALFEYWRVEPPTEMILASYYGYKPSRRKRGKAGVSSSPTEADIAFASICGPVVPFFRLPPDEQQALLDLEGCKTIAEYKAKMKSLRN